MDGGTDADVEEDGSAWKWGSGSHRIFRLLGSDEVYSESFVEDALVRRFGFSPSSGACSVGSEGSCGGSGASGVDAASGASSGTSGSGSGAADGADEEERFESLGPPVRGATSLRGYLGTCVEESNARGANVGGLTRERVLRKSNCERM